MQNKKESIIASNLDRCFICGKYGAELHHIIFGNSFRQHSEDFGLKVPLCRACHDLVHKSREVNYALRRLAQKTFEKKVGTRKEWQLNFEKNYLEVEDE